MVDRRAAEAQRARVERAARELGAGERLWFEVHSARHRRRHGQWKAAVCRPDQVPAVLSGASSEGAVFELDCPSQLPEWLEAIGVRPLQPVPGDWNHLMFFGCDVEIHPAT